MHILSAILAFGLGLWAARLIWGPRLGGVAARQASDDRSRAQPGHEWDAFGQGRAGRWASGPRRAALAAQVLPAQARPLSALRPQDRAAPESPGRIYLHSAP